MLCRQGKLQQLLSAEASAWSSVCRQSHGRSFLALPELLLCSQRVSVTGSDRESAKKKGLSNSKGQASVYRPDLLISDHIFGSFSHSHIL